MKPQLLFIICGVLACTLVNACDPYTGAGCGASGGGGSDGDKEQDRRRRLQSSVGGPCSAFTFANNTNQKDVCPKIPGLNADVSKGEGALSPFARDWIEYTCCQIVTEPMRGIIASVWLWLQVCSKAMGRATDESLRMDDEYHKSNKIVAYNQGPLRTMSKYCPSDLDGGELSEWVVTTFFPVMEEYNPNFVPFKSSIDKCTKEDHPGAVSLLYTTPPSRGAFGHLAMVLHEDDDLELPVDLDTKHYVSFNNYGNTIGSMVTGTKARHVGFGQDVGNVTKVVTLHNADTAKMINRWKQIKDSRQMFDLMEWNCGRTALEVLHAGFPGCKVALGQLWTPRRAFDYATQLQTRMNDQSRNSQIPLKEVNSRQIEDPVKVRTEKTGLPVGAVVAAALASFFGTLILAVIAVGFVIMKMRAEAAQQLESGIAKLLISAAAGSKKGGAPGRYQSVIGEKAPEPSQKKYRKKNSIAPDHAGEALNHEIDADADGQTDFKEFQVWAKEHKLSSKQSQIMWKSLDKDHDNAISNNEWDDFIKQRPNLKWLVTRLHSCAVTPP